MLSVLVMIIVLTCNGSQSQRYNLPNVPCPNIFQYTYDENGYIGIITLRGLGFGKTFIDLEMTHPGPDTSRSAISLNTDESRISDYISAGRPVTFKVDFPNRNIPPLVSAIRLNGMLICSGPKVPLPRTTTNVQYEMTVRPNSDSHLDMNYYNTPSPRLVEPPFGMNYYNPPSRFQEDRNDFMKQYEEYLRRVDQSRARMPNFPWQDGSFNRPVSPRFDNQDFNYPTNPSGLAYINTVCGRQISNIVSQLMVNGQDLTIPTFPWIVAIYKRVGDSSSFFCGGNLISSRSVISAAHCFKEGTDTISTNRLVFSLGRFKLSESENAVNVPVESILIHPDYKKRSISLDADIAIVQLLNSVSFTDTILPICLWRESIENSPQNGLIVGWGEDENRRSHTDIPRYVSVNIVSDSTCVRKKPEMVFITSNRTLCAGDLNGSGPCRGDSGNGLMININGKWVLRGIVSTALANGSSACDLHEYVIFSDIAKFLDWIRENMIL